MHRIAIAGLSLAEAELADIELLGRGLRRGAGELSTGPWRDLADALGASELVVIPTCNRIEVAFAREEGDLPGKRDLDVIASELLGVTSDERARQVARHMHLFVERDAVRYLFRVAASLESLVVGEDQILAQVREAYQRSEDAGLSGPLLAPLFRQALQTGKLVRTKTDLSRHPVSIVSVAVLELAQRTSLVGARALVVGAGKMGRLLVLALNDAGAQVTAVANRSVERAASLALEAGPACRPIALADLCRDSQPFDVIVSATGSPQVVLGPCELARFASLLPPSRKLFAVDVALPRDLDAGGDERIEIVDIEALRGLADSNQARRRTAALEAAGIVDQRVQSFFARASDPLVAQAVSALYAHTQEIVDRELRELRLSTLSPSDREALEQWTRHTAGQLNHVATARIKQLARELEDHVLGSTPRGAEPSPAAPTLAEPSLDG